jgi:hypothetical protein
LRGEEAALLSLRPVTRRQRSFAPTMGPRWGQPVQTRERVLRAASEVVGFSEAAASSQSDTIRDLQERLERLDRHGNAPAASASATRGESRQSLATTQPKINVENLLKVGSHVDSRPDVSKG